MRTHILIWYANRCLIHRRRLRIAHRGIDRRSLRLDGRRLLIGDLFPQLDNLSFHLSVPAPLADSLEVGLDLAVELQPATTRADREWVLDNVAS